MFDSPHAIKANAFRPAIMGSRGAVASGHALASQAGIRILQAGGNAVDAALAVATCLNMVEPNMSGIGGDGFIMVYMRAGDMSGKNARPTIEVCNGTGAAPLRSNAQMFRKSGIPYKGMLSVSVPGICDAWLMAHGKYGSLPLEKVLEPAIEICEEGFPVSHKLANAIASEEPPFQTVPFSADVFCKDNRPLRTGEICRNLNLGKTFRLIAREGREVFYQGSIGRDLVRFSEQAGGLLSQEDFQRHRGIWLDAISTTYRGYTVHEAPPNSSGHVLLQELNLIEPFDISFLGMSTAESVHLMVEAKRLAFADREAFLADPDFVDVPIEGLLSKQYAAERMLEIDPARAMSRARAGDPWRFQSGPRTTKNAAPETQPRSLVEDTTCFVVVDRFGNAVCQLQSIQSIFGSGLIAGDTGILLNNRMTYWHLEEEHPDCLEPGKRVRHTMNPVMVFDPNGNLFLVLGTPGADTQVQTNLQMISHLIDFGLNPQEAIEMPRWRHIGIGTESEYPHGEVDELRLESRFAQKTVDGLHTRGHPVKLIGAWEASGSEMMIQIDPDSGSFSAGADPRRDGYAIVW